MSTPRSSPRYRLYYFNLRGRGEVIRLAFRAAGVPFQDIRVTPEQWAQMKADAPFGSLPLLETEGRKFGESGAILRWAARKFGLAGKSDADQLLVEAALEQALDVRNQFLTWWFQKDEEIKNQQRITLKENVEKVLGRWEKLSKQTKASSRTYTYMVGTSLTCADLAMYDILEHLINHLDLDLSQYPKLQNNWSTVSSLTPVKQYLEQRPQSDI